MKTRRQLPLTILPTVLGLGLLACSTLTPAMQPATEPAAAPATATPTAPALPSPALEPTAVSADAGPAIPEGDLSPEGPWWIFSTPDGLYAVNPDGTGLTQFYFEGIPLWQVGQIRTAPSGGHIAYITGEEIYDTTLRVNLFPWRTLITEMPLTSGLSEPGPEAMPGDTSVEAVRAMTEYPSIAFSPDGRYLAFMGAMDGPTSDLYLFSLEGFETVRLTDGPSQGYQPVWSPDGEYIVHTGVRTFGTGAGYAMEGVWAVQVDNYRVTSLYDPSNSGSEEIVGWADDRTFLVHSWNGDCGPNNLRTFNIETNTSQDLWPGSFRSVAYDSASAIAVAAVDVSFEACNPDGQVGLYYIPTTGSAPFRVVEDEASQVLWSPEAELFLAATEFGVLAIDSTGQYIDLDVPPGAVGLPAVAPVSKDLAWAGESLWIGPLLGSIDNPPKQIFPNPVYTMAWSPSGQSLLFFGEDGLYVALSPDFSPTLVAEGLENYFGHSGWVMP